MVADLYAGHAAHQDQLTVGHIVLQGAGREEGGRKGGREGKMKFFILFLLQKSFFYCWIIFNLKTSVLGKFFCYPFFGNMEI